MPGQFIFFLFYENCGLAPAERSTILIWKQNSCCYLFIFLSIQQAYNVVGAEIQTSFIQALKGKGTI